MSYVNQIKDKEQEMYDIQDKRIRETSPVDAGKALLVGEDGKLEISNALKDGTIPYFASIDDIPIAEGLPQLPPIFAYSIDEADTYICFKISDNSFTSFQLIDEGVIYAYKYEYDNNTWVEEVLYDEVTIPTESGTKLYKHDIKYTISGYEYYTFSVILDTPTFSSTSHIISCTYSDGVKNGQPQYTKYIVTRASILTVGTESNPSINCLDISDLTNITTTSFGSGYTDTVTPL